MAWLANSRDGIETPLSLAGVGIVCVDESSDAVFAARYAENHKIFYSERRDGEAVAEFVIHGGSIPNDASGFGIESDDVSIERAEEYFVAENSDTTVHAAAAGTDIAGQLALIKPDR